MLLAGTSICHLEFKVELDTVHTPNYYQIVSIVSLVDLALAVPKV